MGLKIPPAWYEQPTAFKGNPTTTFGHDAVVPWPRYTQKLDYELEVAAVIGRPAKDVPLDEAAACILGRSEEHTSELQSLMRTSYAVFCLTKKNRANHTNRNNA